ncbi:hypothetical protein CH367_08080 [Leptospira barantonii]|uniref:Uncharacterized protein n=1 Tax=Leptospira barantonii TaxID=2023184 RepID=A0ABX4NTH6_9LEPT|nr:hypothetical protein CH367_08080 [Leptospira barantonii]
MISIDLLFLRSDFKRREGEGILQFCKKIRSFSVSSRLKKINFVFQERGLSSFGLRETHVLRFEN